MKYWYFILIFFCVNLYPQTYFNKTYNFSTNTEAGFSVVMRESGRFVVLGAYFDFEVIPNNPTQSIFFMKLDRFGNEIWLQKHTDSMGRIFPGFNSLMVTNDGGFAFGGEYSQEIPEDLPPEYLIGKFDRNGNKEWFKTYGGDGWDAGSQAKQMYDGGYIIIGKSKSFSDNDEYDAYLVRTDIEGEVIWEKKFGGDGWDQISSIAKLPNRTLLLGGQREDYGLGEWDGYLCKMDMDGNIFWEKTFGTELSDCSVGVSVLKDGNYLIKTCDGAMLHGEVSHQRYVAKLDTLGNVLWRWNMGEVGGSEGITKIQEFSDGSLGFAGSLEDDVTGTFHGWMGRLSSDGILMWEKAYYTIKGNHQNFYDLAITRDDDMIAVGQAFNEEGATNGEGLNLWVVKVNCKGEFEALAEGESCETIVDIEETTLIDSHFQIYPNPTQDQVQFTWNPQLSATRLSIYNVAGQLVEEVDILPRNLGVEVGQGVLSLDSSSRILGMGNWQRGIYFVVLEGKDGVLGREKLVVR